MTTTFRPRRPTTRVGGGGGGGWAPALTPKIAVRIAILGGIAMSLLGVLLVRLWFLQVISGDQYQQRAQNNHLRAIVTEAPRGNIVARDGTPLVTNTTGQNLVARPRELPPSLRPVIAESLSRVIGVPAPKLVKEIAAGDARPLEPVILADNVPAAVSRYLAERSRDFPGISLQNTFVRAYPQGSLAAHLLGSTGRIGPDQIAELRKQGYMGNETIGKAGAEQQYERYLRGTEGRQVAEVNASGEPVGRQYISSQAAIPGRTLQLSIDPKTQRALEAGIAQAAGVTGAVGAAGIAMDPRTGEVLALASYPTFDPSVFVTRKPTPVQRLYRDRRHPLLDRAVAGTYPAGSTFKPITALAALASGDLGVNELLDSPSQITLHKQVFRNFQLHSHGRITLPTALEVSSDTFFYQVADRLWQRQSDSKHIFPLQQEARRFGLGHTTGIDLPYEEAALVPDPPWKQRLFAGPRYTDFQRSWLAGDTIQLGVGQGFLLVTPAQMAVAYAAIANGGTLVTPTIARRVLDPSGTRVLQELSQGRPTRRLGLDATALNAVRHGLYLAANGANGTSSSVFGHLPAGSRVAGKTGTAEPGDHKGDHSWYVGYAPYNDPSIVVAVVVERGGQGANAAAPAACRAFGAYLHFSAKLCGQPTVSR